MSAVVERFDVSVGYVRSSICCWGGMSKAVAFTNNSQTWTNTHLILDVRAATEPYFVDPARHPRQVLACKCISGCPGQLAAYLLSAFGVVLYCMGLLDSVCPNIQQIGLAPPRFGSLVRCFCVLVGYAMKETLPSSFDGDIFVLRTPSQFERWCLQGVRLGVPIDISYFSSPTLSNETF